MHNSKGTVDMGQRRACPMCGAVTGAGLFAVVLSCGSMPGPRPCSVIKVGLLPRELNVLELNIFVLNLRVQK